MNRMDEFNTRLEDLIGIKDANIVCTVAEQQADEYCMQYGVSPQSNDHLAILYQTMLDKVINHYEARR